MKTIPFLILPWILLAACSPVSNPRVLLGHDQDPDEFTRAAQEILLIAEQFKSSTYAMRSMAQRMAGLKAYHEDLAPYCTDSFRELFSRYVAVKVAAFQTDGPSSRFDKAQDDPILFRRWQPDVQLLTSGYGEQSDERVAVINELLLDGKIYTGWHAEKKIVFQQVGDDWLLDDVIYRYCLSSEGSTWEGPYSTRADLRKSITLYEKDLKDHHQSQ